MLTALATRLPVERGRYLLGDYQSGPVLRLLGGSREMRGDDDVVELEQRSRVRLAREHVERRGGHAAGPQRLEQRVFVDELAARGVDDADSLFRTGQCGVVHDGSRLVRERQMKRDDVRRREHVLLRLGPLHAELPKALAGDEGVEREHVHAERECPARHLLADAAEAEQAEGLPRELVAGVP